MRLEGYSMGKTASGLRGRGVLSSPANSPLGYRVLYFRTNRRKRNLKREGEGKKKKKLATFCQRGGCVREKTYIKRGDPLLREKICSRLAIGNNEGRGGSR